jgi:hypothetical protein
MHLSVPFLDTRAESLSWWIGDAPEPLGELVLDSPQGQLALRLLGASHQAVAQVGRVLLPEVVACRGPGDGLGPRALELDGARYQFISSRTTYDSPTLARAAGDLRRRHTGSKQSIVGTFPGSPHALTVLRGHELAQGWRWRTWHVYPGSGEVVRTMSTLVAT